MNQRIGFLATTVLCTLLAGAALAQPPSSTDYELETDSRFTEGCLDPCMCPIWMAEELRGGFELHFSRMDGSFHVFHVLDLAWEYTRGTETILVTGSGSFRVDPDARLQRLELDLTVGEDPEDHFDSGLVEAVEPSSKISVAIAMNDFYCYDRVFEILAAPTTAIPTREATWGMVKARHGD